MEKPGRQVGVGVIVAVALGVIAVVFLGLRLWAASAPVPDGLGVTADGTLADCPPVPNCVSSFAAGDAAVAPLPLPPGGFASVLAAVEQLERTTVVERTDGYARAEARTLIVGYTDDLELLADTAAGVVHVRSASRLGSGDLGVNRERVERLRTLLADAS